VARRLQAGPEGDVGGSAARKHRVSEAARLDAVIHERMRLAILCALAVNESLSFNDLKGLLGATGGNLSVHARKLEDAGYVSCAKGFLGRVQHTDYRITPAGRKALENYLAHMEALILATKG
jgi:DNA-binding MarR family transcriptional regulator